MRVVDLADEFGTTTSETLDLCDRAGVAAADGAQELTDAEVGAVRALRSAPAARAEPPIAAAPPAPSAGGPEVAGPRPSFAGSTVPAGAPVPPLGGPPGASPTTARGGSGPGSHLAVFAVTASLLGFCLPIIPAVIGIVLGTIAKRQASAAGTSAKVTGPATVAQVLGVVVLLGWGAYFAVGFFGSRATVTVGGTDVAARRTAFADVTATDCLVLQKTSTVEDLLVIPCSDPHDAQVIGSVPLDYTPSPTEGDDALAGCQALARESGASGQLVVGALIPSGAARTVAHHDATCILHYADNHAYVGRI